MAEDNGVSRRRFLSNSALALGAITGGLLPKATTATGTRRPNILLFIADDMRWDAFGAAPNPAVFTPTIDTLATEGITFPNNFVTTSLCPTSRASILSGRYASDHGVWGFARSLDTTTAATSVPAILRDAGYQTGFVGKWGFGVGPMRRHFDYWAGFGEAFTYELQAIDGERPHLTGLLEELSLEFLGRVDRTRPYFLMASFKAPHVADSTDTPFQAEEKYLSRYRDVTPPLPPTADAAFYEALPSFLRTSLGRKRWQERFASKEQATESIRRYYALVTGLDESLGRILASEASRGSLDDTLVVFTSDNGFSLGDRGLAGKWHMYEESIRTPLVMRPPASWPGERGERCDAMTLNIDLAPTILDMATQSVPAQMPGVPLLSSGRCARGTRDEWYYELLADLPDVPKCLGVRSARWKYVNFPDQLPKVELLFDLQDGPLEFRNEAGNPAHATVLDQMRKRLSAFRQQYGTG